MGDGYRPLRKAKDGYGFNDQAIDFANEQLKHFCPGDYIKHSSFDGDGYLRSVDVYKILQITLGEYTRNILGFSLIYEPSMKVEHVLSGERREFIKYTPFGVYPGRVPSYHSASIWPFAVPGPGRFVRYYASSTAKIERIDKVEVKKYLENVIESRKREQEKLDLEKQKRAREALLRQKENDSISTSDIDALIKNVRNI